MHNQNRNLEMSASRNVSRTTLNAILHRRSLVAALTGLMTIVTVSSCASPEQRLKERQDKLERFASSVVKHLLDRDPKTYRQSVAALMREELNDTTIDKLQASGNLPEPGLEEMKVVSDAEDKKTSNTVETPTAKPTGPVKSDTVPIQVVGQVINFQDGVKKNELPFTVVVDCKLTDDMAGYPRVVGIRGLENFTATSVRPTEASKPTSSSAGAGHKRRIRRG